VEAQNEPAVVELRIPCRPEYVGVARLALLGVASRMKFSYDQVEDVRLAVGEACTTAVEWASKNKRSDTDIVVRSAITDTKLTVDIIDSSGERHESPDDQNVENEPESLGALLITLLVDEVTVTPLNGGTHVKMVICGLILCLREERVASRNGRTKRLNFCSVATPRRETLRSATSLS
jgi:serine/threonine-protein kinase RsbW